MVLGLRQIFGHLRAPVTDPSTDKNYRRFKQSHPLFPWRRRFRSGMSGERSSICIMGICSCNWGYIGVRSQNVELCLFLNRSENLLIYIPFFFFSNFRLLLEKQQNKKNMDVMSTAQKTSMHKPLASCMWIF